MAISRGAIKVKRGIARVRLSCNSPDGCEGRLTLAQANKKGRKSKAGAPLGSAPFSIAPDRKATVEVKLTRRALKAVTKRGRLAATATATMAGAKSTANITLKGRAETRSKRTRRR